jgi:hypothetical protein
MRIDALPSPVSAVDGTHKQPKVIRFRANLILLLAVIALLSATAASGATIRYESEIHTGNNVMAFYNAATSERDIIKITVQLGTSALFDPTDSAWSLASTTPLRTIPVGHFTPTWAASNTDTQVGLMGTLLAAFSADRRTATFNFTSFNPGEKWGVFVDFDPVGGTGDAAGAAMSGLTVSVLYANGITLTTSCTDPYYTAGVDECYPATWSGQKKSFPSANSATYVSGVPEPMTELLMGSGLLGISLLRRPDSQGNRRPDFLRNPKLSMLRLVHWKHRLCSLKNRRKEP